MAKQTKVLTRDERIAKIKETLHKVDTTTRVKAWVFQVEKQNYVMVYWFKPLEGYRFDVFPSNRKGVKTSEKAIHTAKNIDDPALVFDSLIGSLVTEPLEPSSTI